MLLGSLEGISICGEVVFLRLLSIVEGVNLILGALSVLDFSGISSALGLVKVFPLSISSVLIPFSSFNQSPRNIYQSSMAKQSISLPVLFLRSLMLDSVARSLGPVANLTRQPVRGRRCGEGFDLE